MSPVTTTFLLLATLCFCGARGYMAEVPMGGERCFFQPAKTGQDVHVSYEVVDGGDLTIQVHVWESTMEGKVGNSLYDASKRRLDTMKFTSDAEKKIKLCFSDVPYSRAAKTVMFSIRMNLDVSKLDEDHLDPVYGKVLQLSDEVDIVRDQLDYMAARETVHQATNASTNTRVMWWSILEMLVLVGVSSAQIMAITRFFEVKRRI